MSDHRLQRLEEQLAHQQRLLEELSDVIARQDREIALLQHRLSLLMTREAERAAQTEATPALADRKPPHY